MSEIVDLPVVLALIIGMSLGHVTSWLMFQGKGKVVSRKITDGLAVIVAVMVLVVNVYIMVQTQRAHDCTVRLSATITVEQGIAEERANALQQLFIAAMNPPAEVASLAPDDPARKAWGQQIGGTYIAAMNKTIEERKANEGARNAAQKACGA